MVPAVSRGGGSGGSTPPPPPPDPYRQVRAAPGLTPRDGRDAPAAEPRLGSVINAPTAPNNGGFENRTTDPSRSGKEVTATKGQNTGGFELRATQEQGAH